MDQMNLELSASRIEATPDWRDEKPATPIFEEGALLQRRLAFQEALVEFSLWEKEIRHLETLYQIVRPTGIRFRGIERIEELKSLFVARFEELFLGGEAVTKMPSRKIFDSYRDFKDGSRP